MMDNRLKLGALVQKSIEQCMIIYGIDKDKYSPTIEKVIFSGPCTIVLWSDKTKTVVRCGSDDFDKEKGLAMAIAKKALGNKGNYYETFKKWINDERNENETH